MRRSRVLRLLLLLLLASAMPPLFADDFRPAYLQLRQIDHRAYDVLWKVPAQDESTTLKLQPVFPDGVRTVSAVRSSFANAASVRRWRIDADDGLEGKVIGFTDMDVGRVDVLVRIERLDGTVQFGRVQPVEPRFVVKATLRGHDVAKTYTMLGIEHILVGLDHLLFVLCLVVLVRSRSRLVATITAFTVAHSITLAGATLGWINLPGPPVEAVIALSIVFLATEIIHARQGRIGLTQRHPWTVAFAFGLLHGLGFAGVLAEIGLPPDSIPLALLFFNIGVEIGQLLFVVVVLAMLAAGRRLASRLQMQPVAGIWRVPAYAIGGLASFWLLQRIAAF